MKLCISALACLVMINSSAVAAWRRNIPPFDQRVKDAKYIFVGIPISESLEKKGDLDVDMSVKFRVEKELKGKPGKNIKVHYLLARGDDSLGGVDDFRAGMRQRYKYSISHKIPELVYVKEEAGILITSPEIGGGTTVDKKIQGEIEALSKMKDLK